MKWYYALPFLFLNNSFAQHSLKDSVFNILDYEGDFGGFEFFNTLGDYDSLSLIGVSLDINPKDGVLDTYAFFKVKSYEDSNFLDIKVKIDSLAYVVWQVFNRHGEIDVVLGDRDGNGTLETIIFERKKELKKLEKESLPEIFKRT
ncbi:hypothetical protein J4411_00935 [Candidatus Pacearchaeota archaeon]|nr:hypothetical protein [uncultured archaeon]MBS3084459.1 hypothetical protein [Candidatus Pacearchaeota archaeon]